MSKVNKGELVPQHELPMEDKPLPKLERPKHVEPAMVPQSAPVKLIRKDKTPSTPSKKKQAKCASATPKYDIPNRVPKDTNLAALMCSCMHAGINQMAYHLGAGTGGLVDQQPRDVVSAINMVNFCAISNATQDVYPFVEKLLQSLN